MPSVSFTAQMLPHRYCINDDPLLLMLMVVGNAGIAIAYFSISYKLWQATRQQLVGSILGSGLWYMFAGFIFMCGLTHLMDIVVIWYSLYWVQITLLLMTATISILTALIFTPVVDRLLHNRPRDMFTQHRTIEKPHSPYIERLNELLRREGL